MEYVSKERQWLLIDSQGGRKCAFLHCYIACQSSKSDSFLSWNQDLFFLLTQEAIKLRSQGFMVIAMGDFNSKIGVIPGLEENRPDKNKNEPMFKCFITEVNLFILNTLPTCKGIFTRFMGNSPQPDSMSLLDYGLIDSDSVNCCTSFTIDDQARFDCGSDHALLECEIVLGSSPHVTWAYNDAIAYNYKENTDYTQYQTNLDATIQTIGITKFTELTAAEMLPHISESINSSAKQTFGLKRKKRKKGVMKLPKPIITLIKSKNLLAKDLHSLPPSSSNMKENLEQELAALKLKIKDAISEVKLRKRSNLRSKLLKADPSRKRFWRFLKDQSKSAGSITAIIKVLTNTLSIIITTINSKDDKMVFEQVEIEDAILDHFSTIFKGKRVPVHSASNHTDPESMIELTLLELDQILSSDTPPLQEDQFEEKVCSPYSFSELDQILQNLPNNKAAGADNISNELLKNCSFTFKLYLQTFLNKIIEDGKVPPDLNIGKVMLVFKVHNY